MERHLVIGICTRRRNALLRECLASIDAQSLPSEIRLTVLVVVNDPADRDDTCALVARLSEASPHEILCVVEMRDGIPHARNRAIEDALLLRADRLAFVDDDATAEPGWAAALWRAMDGEPAAVAASGPQFPVFPDGAAPMLTKAAIYRERRLADGSATWWAATNNLMLDLAAVRDAGLRFDPAFAASGGSDKMFTWQLARTLRRPIVWTDAARVHEKVHPDRLRREWIRRRAFRYGASGFPMHRRVHGLPKGLLLCLAKGGAYMAKGVVGGVLAAVGRRPAEDAIADISHGAGFIAGPFAFARISRYA